MFKEDLGYKTILRLRLKEVILRSELYFYKNIVFPLHSKALSACLRILEHGIDLGLEINAVSAWQASDCYTEIAYSKLMCFNDKDEARKTLAKRFNGYNPLKRPDEYVREAGKYLEDRLK